MSATFLSVVHAPVNHEPMHGIPWHLLPDQQFRCAGGSCEAPVVRDWAAGQE